MPGPRDYVSEILVHPLQPMEIGVTIRHHYCGCRRQTLGAHHSGPHQLRIKYLCEDLDVLRRRLKNLAREIERKLDDHEVGKLMMSIEGLGPLTAVCLIAALGDPASFDSPARSRATSA